MTGMKRIGVLRLHTEGGTILSHQVVEVDSDGKVSSYYPLTDELPFTEWKRCDAVIVNGYLLFEKS